MTDAADQAFLSEVFGASQDGDQDFLNEVFGRSPGSPQTDLHKFISTGNPTEKDIRWAEFSSVASEYGPQAQVRNGKDKNPADIDIPINETESRSLLDVNPERWIHLNQSVEQKLKARREQRAELGKLPTVPKGLQYKLNLIDEEGQLATLQKLYKDERVLPLHDDDGDLENFVIFDKQGKAQSLVFERGLDWADAAALGTRMAAVTVGGVAGFAKGGPPGAVVGVGLAAGATEAAAQKFVAGEVYAPWRIPMEAGVEMATEGLGRGIAHVAGKALPRMRSSTMLARAKEGAVEQVTRRADLATSFKTPEVVDEIRAGFTGRGVSPESLTKLGELLGKKSPEFQNLKFLSEQINKLPKEERSLTGALKKSIISSVKSPVKTVDKLAGKAVKGGTLGFFADLSPATAAKVAVLFEAGRFITENTHDWILDPRVTSKLNSLISSSPTPARFRKTLSEVVHQVAARSTAEGVKNYGNRLLEKLEEE